MWVQEATVLSWEYFGTALKGQTYYSDWVGGGISPWLMAQATA